MKAIFTILLLSSFTAFAQKIHLPHEVEKQAIPSGGISYLNQFVSANLRIPFKSAVKGLNNRVFIKGVVEPDGSMTNVEIMRGIDSACNREALRVVQLFRAWKPAVAGGTPVRQSISYPITFKSDPKPGYDSTQSTITEYFDGKYRPVSDPEKYEYRSILPVDGQGYVRHDVVYEQKQNGKWKNMGDAKFGKVTSWYKSDYLGQGLDSIQAYSIFARDRNAASYAPEATFQENGMLLDYTEYGENSKASLHKLYGLNGMVRVMQLYSDSVSREIKWYDNGQIQSITETVPVKAPEIERTTYVSAWKKDGIQTLKDGEGYLRLAEKNYNGKLLAEEGRISGAMKTGKWVGKWADSTLHYEETYQAGVLSKGTAYYGGEKLEYNQARTNPQFKGGMNEFYRFLGSNIKYPTEAARQGVMGKVKMSFVVCEDGSLSDYKVENSIGYGLDEEALRVVKKMSGLWEPGSLRGKAVRVKYALPINFQVQ